MQSQQRGAGIWAMAATAFLWSLGGLFIKIIDWNPIAIAGLRSFIASFVLLLYLRFFREMCGKIEKVSNLSYGRHSTIHANTWHTAALGD